MTPHLTATGRTVLVAACTLILIGAVATSWPVLLLGECLVVLLTVLYYLQVPALRAIEGGVLGLSVRPADGERAHGVVGRPVRLKLALSNRSGVSLANLLLTPEHPVGLVFDPPVLRLGTLRPRQRLTVLLQVTSGQASRHVLHGFRLRAESLSGLLAVSDYLPAPLPVKFLPAAVPNHRRVPPPPRGSADVQRMGAHVLRRRGFGTDFRELRDHAIGDPFRSISWKATARTGKLMVREFEDEIMANAFVLLDISSTMRGGTRPRTKLQHGVELTGELATSLARSQDRLGLITFDEIIYGHFRTASAKSLLQSVLNHLVGLSNVLDPELTELDDDEVIGELVRYLMVQERLDFRRHVARRERLPGETLYDVDLLQHWVGRALPAEEERLGDRCIDAGLGAERALSPIRRFCQLRGVPVPYRLEARFGAKELGMVAALECFLAENRESHLVLLLSDLCGLVDTREIVRALRLVLQRRHQVVVLMPYTPSYVKRPDHGGGDGDREAYHRGRALDEIFRIAERRERGRIAHSISALGIPVIPTGPEDTVALLLRGFR